MYAIYMHYLQTAVFSCSKKYVLWKALIENVVDAPTIQFIVLEIPIMTMPKEYICADLL